MTMRYNVKAKILEVLKLLFFFMCGYYMNNVFQLPSEKNCPPCDCPKLEPQEPVSLPVQLREPYKPTNIFDVMRYDYFTSTHLFNNVDDDPRIGFLGHIKNDLKDISEQAMALYNAGQPKPWKLNKLEGGFRRMDPIRGEEYMLDIKMTPEGEKQSELHRITLVKPFAPAQLLSQVKVNNDKMVHFVLPVSGSAVDKFEIFIKNFEKSAFIPEEKVYLLIVLFLGQEKDKAGSDRIKELAGEYSRKYPSAHIRVIQTKRPFSRGEGIDLGTKQLPQDALLFFCDIDVIISPDFYQRCRLNTELGKQVYFPIVFAQFKPGIVLGYAPKGAVSPQSLDDINKHNGHWVYYGMGMVCTYNIDYRMSGGFDLDLVGWGAEDVDLYVRFIGTNLKIVRSMDPGLLHRYHDKFCDPNLTDDQYRMCIGSQTEGYGAKSQLANLILLKKVDETP